MAIAETPAEALRLTGAAIPVPRDINLSQQPRQVSLVVRLLVPLAVEESRGQAEA